MSFPSVSDVLVDFEETLLLKKVTVINNADFKREEIVSNEVIRAVVQAQSFESINVDNIDFSLDYIQIHSRTDIDIDDVVTWEGKDYRIIARKDYTSRGYLELTGEQIK